MEPPVRTRRRREHQLRDDYVEAPPRGIPGGRAQTRGRVAECLFVCCGASKLQCVLRLTLSEVVAACDALSCVVRASTQTAVEARMAFRRAPLRSSSQAPRHPSGMPARASTQGWSQRGPLSLPWQRGGGQPRRTGARKLKLSKKKQVRMEKTCNEAGSVRATGVKNVPPRQKYFFLVVDTYYNTLHM